MSSDKATMEMNYKELRALAKQYNIKNFYKMKTSQLYKAVKRYEEKHNERDYSFRQQVNPKISSLEEPFSFIEEYKLKATPIPGEELSRPWDEDFTFFPTTIEHYFWVQEGQHDEEPWKCLVKIDDGLGGAYSYYEAACDYTGFDCQGYMKIWVSHSYASLIKFAMNEYTYQTYIKETNPITPQKCANCKEYGFPCANCAHHLI